MSFGVPKLSFALAEASWQMLASESIRGISLASLSAVATCRWRAKSKGKSGQAPA